MVTDEAGVGVDSNQTDVAGLINRWLDEGVEVRLVIERLVKAGLSDIEAIQAIDKVLAARSARLAQALAKERSSTTPGLSNILWGLGLIAAGLGITYISYSIARPGGHYMAASGAVVVGVWNLLKGAFLLIRGSLSKQSAV